MHRAVRFRLYNSNLNRYSLQSIFTGLSKWLQSRRSPCVLHDIRLQIKIIAPISYNRPLLQNTVLSRQIAQFLWVIVHPFKLSLDHRCTPKRDEWSLLFSASSSTEPCRCFDQSSTITRKKNTQENTIKESSPGHRIRFLDENFCQGKIDFSSQKGRDY